RSDKKDGKDALQQHTLPDGDASRKPSLRSLGKESRSSSPLGRGGAKSASFGGLPPLEGELEGDREVLALPRFQSQGRSARATGRLLRAFRLFLEDRQALRHALEPSMRPCRSRLCDAQSLGN